MRSKNDVLHVDYDILMNSNMCEIKLVQFVLGRTPDLQDYACMAHRRKTI